MKSRFCLIVAAVLLFTVSYSAIAKGKPDKVLICHIETESVIDENGEESEIDVYQAKSLPEPAIRAHLRHGDMLIEVDEEGNLTPCESLNDDVITEAEVRSIVSSAAGEKNDDLQTPADIIHPNIHQNNGPGNAACPGDQDQCQNMHGIGNVPGQNPDSVPGVANLANVHGGIGLKNKNVD